MLRELSRGDALYEDWPLHTPLKLVHVREPEDRIYLEFLDGGGVYSFLYHAWDFHLHDAAENKRLTTPPRPVLFLQGLEELRDLHLMTPGFAGLMASHDIGYQHIFRELATTIVRKASEG